MYVQMWRAPRFSQKTVPSHHVVWRFAQPNNCVDDSE
jgi:hypothetical protein